MAGAADWASPVGLTPCDDSEGAFLAWCSKRRVLLPKCRIAHTATTGRCVQATAAIAQGEVVVEVPDAAVLMAEDCSIADLLEAWGLLKPAEEPILEVQGLILALMYERTLQHKSRWGPYLDFMPADLSHLPMFWKEEEVHELQGTAALDKMQGRVQSPADAPTRMEELWQELAQPFILENPRLKLPKGEAGLQLYKWATAVVSSYAFMLGDDHYHALVPIWDALNHVTGRANVKLHHEDRKNGKGVLQMIATRDITCGEEVVNDYGALSNAELLRAYGYVERLFCSGPQPGQQRAGPDPSTTAMGGTGEGSRATTAAADNGGAAAAAAAALHAQLTQAGIPGNANSHVQVPLPLLLEACGRVSGRSGARVRFCRRYKLLPANGVLKLFHNQAPDPCLTEVLRLMLLPQQQFKDFAAGISAWRPPLSLPLTTAGEAAWQLPVATQQSPQQHAAGSNGGKGAGKYKHHKSRTAAQQQDAADAAVLPVAGFGAQESGSRSQPPQALGATLWQTYRGLARLMTQRYTCPLSDDLEVLRDKDRLHALPPRLQAAIVARADEKACWAALEVWLDCHDAMDLLEQQCRVAWQQALAHSRKRGRPAPGQTTGHGEQAEAHADGPKEPHVSKRKARKVVQAEAAPSVTPATTFSFNFAL